jgi:hypothetical protein
MMRAMDGHPENGFASTECNLERLLIPEIRHDNFDSSGYERLASGRVQAPRDAAGRVPSICQDGFQYRGSYEITVELVRTTHKDRSPRTLGPSRAEDRNDRHDILVIMEVRLQGPVCSNLQHGESDIVIYPTLANPRKYE